MLQWGKWWWTNEFKRKIVRHATFRHAVLLISWFDSIKHQNQRILSPTTADVAEKTQVQRFKAWKRASAATAPTSTHLMLQTSRVWAWGFELLQGCLIFLSTKVMLDAQGYLKLIDFGIAKKLPDGESKTFTMYLGWEAGPPRLASCE